MYFYTLNILCNTEVIAVNQDPLGKSAEVINKSEDTFLMVKELEDNSRAVGLFNKGKVPALINVKWSEIGMTKKDLKVRDIWRQKSIGVVKTEYATLVPPGDVVFIIVSDPFKKNR